MLRVVHFIERKVSFHQGGKTYKNKVSVLEEKKLIYEYFLLRLPIFALVDNPDYRH